jgi:hypothetical protein
MNLAVLELDYLTYEFQKGALNYYPRCGRCDLDSLPFEVEFVPPGDFGSIAFRYTETGDTLLFATIIWMGTGELSIPDNFHPPEEFEQLPAAAPDPVERDFFIVFAPVDTLGFVARADTAWTHVNQLDIVRDFAQEKYRAGFYIYTPRVGVFDPYAARWMIFLYRNG